jgi:hypothetical protein
MANLFEHLSIKLLNKSNEDCILTAMKISGPLTAMKISGQPQIPGQI